MLLAGAILIAGANTALTGPRTTAGCDSHANGNDARSRTPAGAQQ